MIKNLFIEKSGRLNQKSIELGQFSILVGSNGSGKTTVLRAIHDVLTKGTNKLSHSFLDATVTSDDGTQGRVIINDNHEVRAWRSISWKEPIFLALETEPLCSMSQPIIGAAPIRFNDITGAELASIYQAISVRDVDQMIEIRNKIRVFFPLVENVVTLNEEAGLISLRAKLYNGALLTPRQAGEGFVRFLAFAALEHMHKEADVFLIENPENGLSYKISNEVFSILEGISRRSQVILTTFVPEKFNFEVATFVEL